MKGLKRLVNFILCICLLACMFSQTVIAVEAEVGTEEDRETEAEKEPETKPEEDRDVGSFADVDVTDVDDGIALTDVDDGIALTSADAGIMTASTGSISLNSYNNGGTITLDSDVTASGVCQLNGNLTIDLNGHSMTMSGGSYFMLNSNGAVLTIKDSIGGGIVYASCQLVWCYQGGTFNLYGGTLDGSQMTTIPGQGGCVNLSRNNMGTPVFNMYGGTIQGFEASQYGGAVYVASTFSGKSPVFNLYGGTICNCYAPAGSAVYVDYNGDGPGYFYIKGGTKQDEGGESKAVIDCVTYEKRGTVKNVPNAVYNYGYMGMEGVVDIDGIVYLNQNNWASTVTHFIKITGRLVVVGDGYIDVDTAYPNTNGICTGHTVVENATRTSGTTGTVISPEEFYTYGSYFINSTKGLTISAGFAPDKNSLDSTGAPANWPSYQADKYSKTYTYVDVEGQTMIIQASDSPGNKRQMQNYDYLIYTQRADPEQEYAQYYSIKISKKDITTGNPLDGAVFYLEDSDGNKLGTSGSTGDKTDGMESGETYIYLDAEKSGKLMIDDGTYTLVEEKAPDGYVVRNELASVTVSHVKDESTGETVSVVQVMVNNKVLTSQEQVINSSYGDKGMLVNREIVLSLNNSTEVIQENVDYRIQIEKYDTDGQTPLANAGFVLNTQDTGTTVSKGSTDEAGKLVLQDENGAVFTFSNGDSYVLTEESPPQDYYAMEDAIRIAVDDGNQVLINETVLSEGTQAEGSAPEGSHGSWKAVRKDDLIIITVYDEKMPPTWSLLARKYGTQVLDALALAGAEFKLYQITDGVETELITVTSSDGTDGAAKGTLSFVNPDGTLMEFSCNATYCLRETKAPQGYDLLDDIIISVNGDGSVITITQNGTPYTGASFTYDKDVRNQAVTLMLVDEAVYYLPKTGKTGIYPLVMAGTTIMCICMVLLTMLFGKCSQDRRTRKS